MSITGAQSGDKKNMSLDSIFQQMLKANQVNDEQTGPLIVALGENNEESDSESGRKDLSTREMNYEALMVCLGKKTLKTKQAERKKMQEEAAQREEYENQRMPGDSMYDQKLDGEGSSQNQLLVNETQGGSSRRKGAR